MKKLLIAACAIAIAAVSHGAALTWSTWGYTGDDPDSGLLDGSAAYLVLVTDVDNFAVANNLSITGGSIIDKAAFSEGVAAGIYNDVNDDLAAGTKYYFAIIGTTAGDPMVDGVPSTGLYGIDTDGANGTGSGFYEVVWNGSTGGTLACDWDNYGGLAANTPIPEPTSGLLMLVGLAGLALRRRRA